MYNIIFLFLWFSLLFLIIGYNLWWLIIFFIDPLKIKQRTYKEIGKANISFIATRVYMWRSQAIFHTVINIYDNFLYITQFRSKWFIDKQHLLEFKSIPQTSFFNLFKMYEFKIKIDSIYKQESIYFLLTKKQADIIENFIKSENFTNN